MRSSVARSPTTSSPRSPSNPRFSFALPWKNWFDPNWFSAAARHQHAIYSFKHALVQDAAYGSVLKSRRHQLHARIAAVLERIFPETIANRPEVLAHHLSQAGLHGNAVEYWRKAGEIAARRLANVEAITISRRRSRLLRRSRQSSAS